MFNILKTPNRGPSPFSSWPLPLPLPQREGRNHRGYPYFAACVLMRVWSHLDAFMTNPQHLTSITQHPSEASPPAPLRMERGVITEVTPTPSPTGPSPFPSPEGKGSDHRDTPMANHQHLTTITQHPSLAETLCELCMPEAFCGLETVSLKPP